ncbi:MAG TPA: Uma2 family endonuclease [Armatimonadota bacterium]|nr:Uma2 family endonuclease [Armatimonadota bacterium]
MTTSLTVPDSVVLPEPRLPPLQNGDRLTRDDFERRYEAMPDCKKAELIEGVVYMPSPVLFREHAQPHFNVITWLGQYCIATVGVWGGDNGSLRLDLKNMPQPDAFLLIRPEYGGQARIGEDGYVEGAPELVVEIAASSASYDLNVKLHVYQRNGVREYVVWRVWDSAVDWFVLREDRYDRLPLDADGLYRSEVFPGLWLDPAALIAGDLGIVGQVLQQGTASPEHRAFVMRLKPGSQTT